jgi:histone-lysine N-methyltransferase SETMAR
MDENKENIKCLLHKQFLKKEKAAQAVRNINTLFGHDVTNTRTAQRWFKSFREGRTSIEHKKGAGRPPTINYRALAQRLRRNPDLSPLEMSKGICSSRQARRWLRKKQMKPLRNVYIPHQLTAKNKEDRKNLCLRLLQLHKRGHFFSRLITCDESWVYFDNPARKTVWRKSGEEPASTPRRNLHGRKKMLCIFWSRAGPVHWELLPTNTSITSDLYCKQLEAVDLALKVRRAQGLFEGRPLFQQDNARPHTSKKTLDYMKETLGWDLLPHPPYSPDIAPSDYHLFRSLKNYLRGKRFKNDEEVQNGLGQFFVSKMGTDFFERGLKKLPERWRAVVSKNGDYLID